MKVHSFSSHTQETEAGGLWDFLAVSHSGKEMQIQSVRDWGSELSVLKAWVQSLKPLLKEWLVLKGVLFYPKAKRINKAKVIIYEKCVSHITGRNEPLQWIAYFRCPRFAELHAAFLHFLFNYFIPFILCVAFECKVLEFLQIDFSLSHVDSGKMVHRLKSILSKLLWQWFSTCGSRPLWSQPALFTGVT